jgi:hypothetical protein
MNMLPLVISWSALALAVLGLAFYRKSIADKEDDVIHVNAPAAVDQTAIAKKLEVIDKWGKTLTIIAAVYALVLFGVFLYNGWNETGRITG